MMDTKLSILFYSKTSKQTKDGLTPIYLRVTIDGERFEQSTQRYISLKGWSKEAGRAKGNSEEARTVNYLLDSLRQKVYDYQREIILDNEPFNILTFKKKWLGIKERTHSLLEVFKEHNEHLAADERIKMPHLCLYAVLYQVWKRGNFINPIVVKRKEIMLLSKINAKTTYHKCLKELESYAYIVYKPSYHPTGKTEVYLLPLHN